MGTRADFYTKKGDEFNWLGSIAWDGHPDTNHKIATAMNEENFINEVEKMKSRRDWTSPELGWPWPWDDSNTTDYAYVAESNDDGFSLTVCSFGTCNSCGQRPKFMFPNMSGKKNVTFGERSGVIIVGK